MPRILLTCRRLGFPYCRVGLVRMGPTCRGIRRVIDFILIRVVDGRLNRAIRVPCRRMVNTPIEVG